MLDRASTTRRSLCSIATPSAPRWAQASETLYPVERHRRRFFDPVWMPCPIPNRPAAVARPRASAPPIIPTAVRPKIRRKARTPQGKSASVSIQPWSMYAVFFFHDRVRGGLFNCHDPAAEDAPDSSLDDASGGHRSNCVARVSSTMFLRSQSQRRLRAVSWHSW